MGAKGKHIIYANIFVDTILLRYGVIADDDLREIFINTIAGIACLRRYSPTGYRDIIERDSSWTNPGIEVGMTTVLFTKRPNLLNVIEGGEKCGEVWSLIMMNEGNTVRGIWETREFRDVVIPKVREIRRELEVRHCQFVPRHGLFGSLRPLVYITKRSALHVNLYVCIG